jgi:ribose transport system substrate-binding protein
MRRKALWALAVLASSTMTGCGPRVSYKYKIAVIPKGLSHEFWLSIRRGAERAAADLAGQGVAVQVLWDGPNREDEAQPQINFVNQSIAARVNGIVLAPQHSDNMIDVVRKAKGENIPVVIIDSGLNAEDLYVKYVATDNYRGGQLAAEHLLKVLREQDKKQAPRLVLFRYAPNSESTEQREKGFKDYVDKVIAEQTKAGKPAITWASTNQHLGATEDEAQKNSRPLLSGKLDSIDGVFTPNESSTHGVAEVLRGLKPKHKVRLVGFDASEPLLTALRNGEIDGLVVQDPYRMGYLGVWVMVQHLEGVNVAPGGKKYLGTGEVLLTRENVDQESRRGLFEEAIQAKRTIALPKFSD